MAISSCTTVTDGQGRELVEHGTALFPVACYHDDLTKEEVPWHWHEELEAVVIAEGSVVVAVGREKRTLHAGEGYFANAGVLHAGWLAGDAGCRFHSLVFHPRLVGGSIDSIFWQGYVQPLLKNPCLPGAFLTEAEPWQSEALTAIESAWQACAAEQLGYEFAVRAALSRLVLALSACRPAVAERPGEKALRDGERLKTMLQYIQDHYAEPLTAGSIAAAALVSESECLRCFRSIIGTPPVRYLKQFRVQKAAERLLAGQEKIAQVGAECGFQDISYFVKSFREQKGCTPSEYRAQHRKADEPPKTGKKNA